MSERQLIVNLDAVAIVRQARGAAEPDPVAAATLAGLAGADGISVHLREDRSHVQDRDARVLRQTVRRGFRMNVAPEPELLKVALEIRPDSVTLVPELPAALAPDGGLDLASQLGALGEMVRALEDGKIRSGLLVSAELEQIKFAHRVGASAVELHAGRFAEDGPDREEELMRLRDAAQLACKLGLLVGLGGGLDYRNVRPLLGVPGVTEFCVGHAIAARALLVGMERAVREMKELVG